jgi:hypothetical protein
VEKYVPKKIIKTGSFTKPSWFRDRAVRAAKTKQRSSYIRYRESGLNVDKYEYERAKLRSVETINRAKTAFENKLVNNMSENPKLFYNYCKHFTKSSSTVDSLHCDGKTITEDSEKADLFNKFFCLGLDKGVG